MSYKKANPAFIITAIIVAIVSLTAGIWLNQQLQLAKRDQAVPPGVDATVLPKARPLSNFSLITHDGRAFTLSQLQGHWSILFFGYTHCPDVCPTTLQVMKMVWQKLQPDTANPHRPRLYFVSVDPDRDDKATLQQYVQYFHPDFTGVTGKADEIDKLVNQLGIMYGFDEKNGDNKDYIVNHSASLVVIDPQGRMRALISPPHIADRITADFQTIRNFYGE